MTAGGDPVKPLGNGPHNYVEAESRPGLHAAFHSTSLPRS